MLELPIELEMPPFSVLAMVDHSELGNIPGESGMMGVVAELWVPFREGMVIPPRPPTTGEESGDGCSARVE